MDQSWNIKTLQIVYEHNFDSKIGATFRHQFVGNLAKYDELEHLHQDTVDRYWISTALIGALEWSSQWKKQAIECGIAHRFAAGRRAGVLTHLFFFTYDASIPIGLIDNVEKRVFSSLSTPLAVFFWLPKKKRQENSRLLAKNWRWGACYCSGIRNQRGLLLIRISPSSRNSTGFQQSHKVQL